ncbi:MAG: hypothetical protein J6F30_15015 [Cellulosilyticum sp.]|nr:hypothetical protein [Cellulosilyticum sp.]
MDDIIKQIAQIDSVAVSNRRNSEEALQEKRKAYEKQMSDYYETRIQKAKEKAEQIYSQIVSSGEDEHHIESEKSRKSMVTIQNYYTEIEQTLLDEVFNELFKVEG